MSGCAMTTQHSPIPETDLQPNGGLCAVLGIGNPLLGDEAIGIHVLERLRNNYRFSPEIALIDGGCGGLNLYFILEQYDKVIVVDAISSNTSPPGSIHIIDHTSLTGKITKGCSAHSVGIQDSLMMLQTLQNQPRDLVVVGVVPAVIEYNFNLSSVIKQRLPLIEFAVIKQLRLRNVEVLKQ